jgi:hypothetical protein
LNPILTFDNYEEVLAPFLFKSGKDYFEGRKVQSLKHQNNKWTAFVKGNKLYQVELTVDRSEIHSAKCNCPSKSKPVCKHIIALIYAIEVLHSEIIEPDPLKRHLRFLEKKMREFVVNGYFGEEIKQKVADDAFQQLLMKGESFFRRNSNSACIQVCQAIINYTFTYIGNDGKGGEILENYANKACSLLFRTIEKGIEDSEKSQLYDFLKLECLKLTKGGIGFTPAHFLEIFPVLIINKEKETDFFNFVEFLKEQGKTDGINFRLIRKLIEVKIHYLENLGRKDEVFHEIESNCEDIYFFKMLIQVEIQNGNYSNARQLAVKATGKFRNYNRYGTWFKLLLEIALKTKDKNAIRFYAGRLFWTSYRNMEYFRIVKSTYHDKIEWMDYVEDLLNTIGIKRKFRYNAILESAADILAEENYTDRLCELLEDNNVSPELIDKFSGYIALSFPSKLLKIYRKVIINYADRPRYRSGERFLKSFSIMKTLPGGTKVSEEIFQYLLTAYPKRVQMVRHIQNFLPDNNS